MALRDVVDVARHDALGDEAYVAPPLGVRGAGGRLGLTWCCAMGSELCRSCGFSFDVEVDVSGVICRGVMGELQRGLGGAGP